jgi:acyl-CoA synthetase (AMP-forming)/AMP-acid ligase II
VARSVSVQETAEHATVPGALAWWAGATPESLALSRESEELSYAELDSLVGALAGQLAAVGAADGERIVLVAENGVAWVVAFLAGLRAGAVVVPLNTRLGSDELRRQIDACAPRLVLATQAFRGLLETVTAGTTVLSLERDAGPTSVWSLPTGGVVADPAPDAPALIAFTSGTTAEPKGAVISHAALARSAGAFVPPLGTDSADGTLVLVPLFHNTGFVDQLAHMLLVGGSIDLLSEFHARDALAALARRPASYLIAVPSIYRLLMLEAQADAAFRSCRIAVYGGSPMPAPWAEELRARWPHLRLFNCYGLTEFTSVSHLLTPEHGIPRGHTVGRPVADVCQQVVGEDERPVPAGEPGEVWLSGPMRMRGYWRNDRATAAVFRGDWLQTGDHGAVDAEGFLTLLGRSAEVINRGGEKVYAAQVEAALCRLDSVAEAAVVGAPHPVLQEAVVAYIVLRPGHELDEEGARQAIAPHVAEYAQPERFVVVADLPRNPAGKLDRRRLRDSVAEPAGDPS